MSKVSIIVPVYNVEEYLPQCVGSIIRQTFSDFELLLVDDGSTDASGVLCDRYAEADNRIKAIHQKNAGAANAKNTGLDIATGEYIAFVDSDDWVESNWLERVFSVIASTNATVVEYSFVKEGKNGQEQGNDSSFIKKEFTAKEYMAQYLDIWTCSLFWNKVFQRNLMDGIRFRRERRCIDDEFFTYKALSKASSIIRIEDELYHYRQREKSAVTDNSHRVQIIEDAMELRPERYEWIKAYFPQLRYYYLEHDMDFLIYWAKNNDFTRKLAEKYKKTTKYYIRECVQARCSISQIRLMLTMIVTTCKIKVSI